MNFSWFTANTNRIYYLLVGLIVLVVFATIILILRNVGSETSGGCAGVTLEFWGVFDTNSAYSKNVSDFTKLCSGLTVRYSLYNYDQYEKALIDALASGRGPDIFMIHHTWLAKHADKLLPMPDFAPDQDRPLMTLNEFNEQFVEVAYNDLVLDNKIYGIPLYVDTLALYYNRDLFNTAGITQPPKTWEDFKDLVEDLTRLDSRGNITQSGAALGTAKNINRSTDILMSLMIQNGTQMTNSTKNNITFQSAVSGVRTGENALEFYTQFADPQKRSYTWNNALHYSLDAFSEGTVAMMFNYSHQAPLLRSKNPRLNFAVAPMPQVASDDTKTYANYWALAVSKATKNPNPAWGFINYVGSRDGALSYLSATGRPSARRDIVELQKEDRDLGIFALQALTAKSWFQIDNLAIEEIFAAMIENVISGKEDLEDALSAAASKINVLMRGVKPN